MIAPDRRQFVRHLATGGAAATVAALTASARAAVPPGAAGAQGVHGIFNVRDFGARGDGTTKDTRALQAAIDACAQAGGGTVVLPAGRYLSGTLTLRSHLTLHLGPGAVLLGSPEPGDYEAKPFPARDLDVGGFEIWALLYADGAQHLTVEGPGIIDANGKPFPPLKKTPDVAGSVRPRAVFLKNCRQLRLREVTVLESAMWSVHLARCAQVWLEGLNVFSSHFYNQDGIVLDSCRDVMVSGCYVNTIDDAIVIKASFPEPCTDIAITNCVLTSRCAAIKFGTQSLGGFRNVSISNCACHDCGLGGVKLLTVDGGDLENVVVSNLTMTNVSAPLFLRLGNRGQDFGFKEVTRPRPVARLRHIIIRDIRAEVSALERFPGRRETMRTGATMGIAGLIGHPVEDVVLENIHVTYPGGGTLEEARRQDIPEREANYPENTTFGVLPAYGLYLRHARGITLREIHLELARPDLRPAVVGDDVEDLRISRLAARGHGDEPLIRLSDTRRVTLQDSRPLGPTKTFVRLEGARTDDVVLQGNDLREAREPVVQADAPQTRVLLAGNLTRA